MNAWDLKPYVEDVYLQTAISLYLCGKFILFYFLKRVFKICVESPEIIWKWRKNRHKTRQSAKFGIATV